MSTKLLTTNWQRLPEATVRALQAERLHRWLRDTVLPFSAHYRELFRQLKLTAAAFRSLDDLRRLPFTSKADLLNTPDNPQKARDFLLVPDRNILSRRPTSILGALLHGRAHVAQGFENEFRPIFLTSTTGRSADPVPFLYTNHDLANLQLAGERVFGVCGARREDKLLNMFPYAPHLAFWLAHYGSTAFGVFTASTGGGKVMGTEGQLRFLRKIRPDVLIGMPTFVYHVLHQAAEEGVRCENLRRIVLGGEKVPDGMRLKLRNLAVELGARELDVVTTYGFTEAKMAFAECPVPVDEPSSGYHLYPDLGVVEVVDPKTGEPVPNGQPGEIVFTPLDSRGTVVLRYRTGDYIDGGLTYEACPHCRRQLPRLVGKISRSSAFKEVQLDKIKGTLVDFNELEHVLDDAPNVGAWQIELRKLHDDPLEVDELILHVQKTNGADDDHLIHELRARLASHCEISPNRIEFHTAEKMRDLQGVGVQLKEQKLVDHRPTVAQAPCLSSNSTTVKEAA
jgi:phenylacetate-CoA ligase